ncbi:MAG: aminotransferase class IV [Candidatus Aminicenantes bacterium]|nr:aminotransferase class IV [Candidatus Aminicenantes bacterium]
MAGFEGVKWASKQMRYLLDGKRFEINDASDRVYAVSRSIHYGLFLAFEGIRFFCRKQAAGKLEVLFLNWDKNLERFRRGISFNLSESQQNLVPSADELIDVFIHKYFKEPSMLKFLEEMAELEAQGYFRPFTVDEDQSIGVTFPGNPAIRAVACRYDRYLGEPFTGVVVPNLVRAIAINNMGCLKLGVNYLVSVKAVDAAKKLYPGAASALFLDDKPHAPLKDRVITEWDSSCCLFAYKDGSVVKIPESPLILPSVTIQGITAILKKEGVPVAERDITYGELIDSIEAEKLVTVCSVGTAGILNRCQKLVCVDEKGDIIVTHDSDESHNLFEKLGDARTYYWNIFLEKAEPLEGLKLFRYVL